MSNQRSNLSIRDIEEAVADKLKPVDKHLTDLSREIIALKNEIKPPKPKKNAWSFKLRTWGAVVLFISWILQNYFEQRLQSALNEIDANESANLSSFGQARDQEIAAEVYNYFLLRDSTEAIKNALNDALQTYTSIITDMNETTQYMLHLADDKSFNDNWMNSQNDSINAMRSLIDSVANSGNLNALQKMFSLAHTFETSELNKTGENIQAYRYRIKTQIDEDQSFFLCLYIFGSICLGIGFWLDNKENLRKFFKERTVLTILIVLMPLIIWLVISKFYK